jgi:hypothetical protein
MSDPKQCNDKENVAIGAIPTARPIDMNAPEPRQAPLSMQSRPMSTKNDGPGSKA